MRRLIVLALVGLSLTALQADEPKPKPSKVVLPVGEDYVPTVYRGRVVTLTDTTITIKPEGDVRAGPITFLPDGTEVHRLYIQDNTKPPKTFVFAECLNPKAKVGPITGENGRHRVADVCVGDIVWINCMRFRGNDACLDIVIQRRPGGQVPLAVGDDQRPVDKRIATGYNAAQQREEKAIATLQGLLLRFRP